jgi:predicted MFS family arabinose efflux permease
MSPAGLEAGPTVIAIGLLASTMASALFPIVALGVLARPILDELTINRTQLGLAVTVASTTSAVAAIALGRLTDRQGGRTALLTVLLLGSVSAAGIAMGPSYVTLLVSSAIAGLAMSSANPATNRLVAELVPQHRRGTVTGIKQAGEAMTIVLCGALLPFVAVLVGWRGAFWLGAAFSLAAIALTLATFHHRAATAGTNRATAGAGLDRNIVWLAVYSMFVGLAGGSVATYLPLYAQEALHMRAEAAGLVVAAMGTVAVVGRIVWGHHARVALDLRGRFLAVAVLSLGSALALWAASLVHPALVWVGAAGWGISLLSVGAIGNLAVLAYSVVENTGRASGVMLTGFGIGLMVGPPVFGWTVDATGRYDVGFGLLTLELIGLTVVGLAWVRLRQRGPA